MREYTVLADTPEYRPFIRSAGGGKHTHRPAATICPHRPQLSYMLQWVRSGAIEISWPDGETTIAKEQAIIIAPGTRYATRTAESAHLHYVHFTVDQNVAWRGIRPDFCFGLRSDEQKHMLQPPPEAVWGITIPRELPSLSNDRVSVGLPQLIGGWLSDDRIRRWRAQDRFGMLIRNIVTDIMVAQSRRTELSVEARVSRAETVAAQSLHLGFDVNQMARVAGYDRSYFSVLYRRLRGESAKTYLARLRLDEAKRLLLDRALTVLEVATRLGYNNPVVLSRMFKRHTGRSPTEWRERQARP